MIPKINQEICIGCGSCVALCPKIFQLNNDGKAEVLAMESYDDFEECSQDAANSCPVQAILIER